MLQTLTDLSAVTIIKDDFITFENTLKSEFDKGFLYDDMFLAESKQHDLLLDIGWMTPDDSFNNGYFQLCVIKHNDWDTPLLMLKAKDKTTFLSELHTALSFIIGYRG